MLCNFDKVLNYIKLILMSKISYGIDYCSLTLWSWDEH